MMLYAKAFNDVWYPVEILWIGRKLRLVSIAGEVSNDVQVRILAAPDEKHEARRTLAALKETYWRAHMMPPNETHATEGANAEASDARSTKTPRRRPGRLQLDPDADGT
jgi:hypothetical protein